jgi:hypothetical protein
MEAPITARCLVRAAASWSFVMTVVVAGACCSLAGQQRVVKAKTNERPPIYRCDSRADQLCDVMFPRTIACSGVTNAYARRNETPAFGSVIEVCRHHSLGINRASSKRMRSVEIGDDHLESYWLSVANDQARVQGVLERAPEVEQLAGGLADSLSLRALAPLEKAVLQRDVLQMCCIFSDARRMSNSAESGRAAVGAFRALKALWRSLLLTPTELNDLLALRPTGINDRRFTSVNSYDLGENYLPQRVIRKEAGWFEIPFVSAPARHYIDFAGRSFIRAYIKPIGLTGEQFRSYWRELQKAYGAKLTLFGRASPLPAGTETLLVRTFAVFLDDGTCVDSGFPEEVGMRIFKHERSRLDLKTSDFRGTLIYQYKMRRRDLLSEPKSLGLRRIHETDPQFFGFLSEVPDSREASSPTLTIMRSNCVSCHSEALYGVSTVLSLAQPVATPTHPDEEQGGLLKGTGVGGRFRLRAPRFQTLQDLME